MVNSQQKHGEFTTGMAMVWVLNLLGLLAVALIAAAVGSLLSSLRIYFSIHPFDMGFYYAFLFAQLTQLPYAIPLWLRFRRRRRFSAAKGAVFGAFVALGLGWALFVALVRFFQYVSEDTVTLIYG